jgi:hypothetical protein
VDVAAIRVRRENRLVLVAPAGLCEQDRANKNPGWNVVRLG